MKDATADSQIQHHLIWRQIPVKIVLLNLILFKQMKTFLERLQDQYLDEEKKE